MFEVTTNATRVVADDAQIAIKGFDEALLNSARLSISVLEATGNSTVPARETQLVLRAVHNSTGHMLDARSDMIRAVAQLTSIKQRSTQAPMALGCPGETPISGSLESEAPTAPEVAPRDAVDA